jgi:hypothetical protein
MDNFIEDWRNLKTDIRTSVEGVSISQVPITIAKEVLDAKELSFEDRKFALGIVRKWVAFAEENQIKAEDYRALRYQFGKFCQQEFKTREVEPVVLQHRPASDLVLPDGTKYLDYVRSLVGQDITKDTGIAVYGGVARIGLKLLAIKDGARENILENELPASDIDVIIEEHHTLGEKFYGADVAGTRVVSDLDKDTTQILSNVECLFNQVMLRGETLFFSQGAYDDVITGEIHFTDKEDVLFGSEVEKTESGQTYINRNGLYRAFNFLIRGKASKLVINKENLERELSKMGNYWAVLLFVKVLPIQEQEKRNAAIARWYNLAKNLGFTKSSSPQAFLEELLMTNKVAQRILNEKEATEKNETHESQAKWLIGKVVDRAVEYINLREVKPSFKSLETVTIDQSSLAGGSYDVDAFLSYIKQKQNEK